MKIKQLIEEHIGMIEDIIENDPNGDLGRVKRVAHYFSRKLIEVVGEEIIGKDTKYKEPRISHTVWDHVDSVNTSKKEQRLKLKEIISSLK